MAGELLASKRLNIRANREGPVDVLAFGAGLLRLEATAVLVALLPVAFASIDAATAADAGLFSVFGGVVTTVEAAILVVLGCNSAMLALAVFVAATGAAGAGALATVLGAGLGLLKAPIPDAAGPAVDADLARAGNSNRACNIERSWVDPSVLSVA